MALSNSMASVARPAAVGQWRAACNRRRRVSHGLAATCDLEQRSPFRHSSDRFYRGHDPMTDDGTCWACREPIRAGAVLCRHCGSSQKSGLLRRLKAGFGWVLAVLAIVPLVLATSELWTLRSEWLERENIIDRLLVSAELRSEWGEYEETWEVLKSAAAVSPLSSRVAEAQFDATVRLIRKLKVSAYSAEYLEQLLPILHEAAGSSDRAVRGTAFTYMAWAEYIRANDWTCPGLVESLLLTPGQPSRTGPGSGSRASSAAGSDCRTRRCI